MDNNTTENLNNGGALLSVTNPPTNITVDSATDTTINLKWDGVAGATGYNIYRADTEAGAYTKVGESTGTTYSDSGLLSGRKYYYKISAYDNDGEGPQSESIETATAALPPENVSAAAVGSDSVRLTWTAPAGSPVDGYRIYRSNNGGNYTMIQQTADTNYTDTGLLPGTQYAYRLESYIGGVASALTAPVTVTTPAAGPGAPQGLMARAVSDSSINLEWTAPTGTVTGYRIYRALSPTGNFAEIGTSAGTAYGDNNLSPGTIYYYRVTAYNAGEESAPSNTASAATYAVITPPNRYVCVNLSWPCCPLANSYLVIRSAACGGTCPRAIARVSCPCYRDCSAVNGMSYCYKILADICGDWVEIANIPFNACC